MNTSLLLSLLIVLKFFDCTFGSPPGCAKILPDSAYQIPVEVGKEFTAVCSLTKEAQHTSKDIGWFMGDVTLPRELYKIINESAVSVTLNVSTDMKNPLRCSTPKGAPSYKPQCTYGIYLDKGYPPLKPKHMTCVSVQVGTRMSQNLTCSWDPELRNPLITTNYTLFASVFDQMYSASSDKPLTHSLTVSLTTFPHFVPLHVWLEAKNALGSMVLDKRTNNSEDFVKPNPPSHVWIIPESNFPKSLMLNWTHPIHYTVFKLKYSIRYCEAGSRNWIPIDENITRAYTESFRLQSLEPYTDYVVQMRCKHHEDLGYWSDWSSNVTSRTPEATPESGPDLWRVYEDDDTNVKLIWKDPVKSNGKILAYNLTIDGVTESLVVHSKEYVFQGTRSLIKITANNSAGVSPVTTLEIHRSESLSGVDKVLYSVRGGRLWVEWQPPTKPERNICEYLLECVSIPDKQRDWQRVAANTNSTAIEGDLQPFKRYNISVYPIYKGSNCKSRTSRPGKRYTVAAYLQQGPPLKGPAVDVTNTKKNTALLKWEELSIDDQQGFLTNYTIFYKKEDSEQSAVVVQPNVCSYKLTELDSDSLYVVYIMASTSEGSVDGPIYSFYTKKYGDGEIEVIVVLVCLGFLFFIVFIMMLSLKNREVIKKRLWPQVPDPHHSTIATWSPDCPIRTDTPKEATLPDVSVVEVDVFDRKSLCEEDKNMLPLKKDKYFSEEHSSGIGGSSCMSSPRQSVSDSDEGDSGQTTASTVQYSSVVASGYKGQTPSLQAPVFARSESTQPLLDCEEHQEHLLDSSCSSSSSSHQRNSYFKRGRGLEQLQPHEAEEPGCFSPMEEEDTPTLTEDPPGPAPGYMPQQSGYRPQ